MNLCGTSPKKYDLMYVPQPRGIGLPGHLEGRGDVVSLVSWFITPLGHMMSPDIPIINLISKAPLTLQAEIWTDFCCVLIGGRTVDAV